jgi:uncharacterized protein (TIGR03435 family)
MWNACAPRVCPHVFFKQDENMRSIRRFVIQKAYLRCLLSDMKTKPIFAAVKIWLFLASLFVGLSLSATENSGPKVGDKPPLLQATDLLQAPPGAKMNAESLHGKVVILEFWATWCGPCVAAIPHLNELAEKFKGKAVQFIAITAEDEATVERFLAKRPIKAWIAMDTNNGMNKAYGVTGIPHTVILDKKGKIAAITYPTFVTEKSINDLLAGKKISFVTDGGAPVPAENKKEAPPLFQVLIRPSSYSSTVGWWQGSDGMSATGITIEWALPIIFDTHHDRIITNTPLPAGLFDFSVVQPRGSDADPGVLMQEAVKSTFGLTGKWETNQVNAFVLKLKDTNAPDLTASPTKGVHLSTGLSSGVASVWGVGVSSATIASFLEDRLEVPVIDETGLTNRYGYDVSLEWKQKSWDKPNLETLKRALTEQLGLELISERLPVEVLVIDRVKMD